PSGAWCLTNNYRHDERNIRAILPDAPEGAYRYVALDAKDQYERDDHPRFGAKTGPPYQGVDPLSVVEDLGGVSGWISFNKGSLTGSKRQGVLWNFKATPEPGVIWGGMRDSTTEIDLGQAYFVRGLDVLWAGPYYNDLEIWGKAKAEDEWTFMFTHN